MITNYQKEMYKTINSFNWSGVFKMDVIGCIELLKINGFKINHYSIDETNFKCWMTLETDYNSVLLEIESENQHKIIITTCNNSIRTTLTVDSTLLERVLPVYYCNIKKNTSFYESVLAIYLGTSGSKVFDHMLEY